MEDQKNERSGTQLAPGAVTQLIENQKHELELRAGELRLKAQEDEHAFKHAGKALEAEERDRRDERLSRIRAAKHRYWFVGLITTVCLLFVLTLVYMGKDQLAAEIVKMAVSLATGAIGGFFYGRNKAVTQSSVERDAGSASDSEE